MLLLFERLWKRRLGTIVRGHAVWAPVLRVIPTRPVAQAKNVPRRILGADFRHRTAVRFPRSG